MQTIKAVVEEIDVLEQQRKLLSEQGISSIPIDFFPTCKDGKTYKRTPKGYAYMRIKVNGHSRRKAIASKEEAYQLREEYDRFRAIKKIDGRLEYLKNRLQKWENKYGKYNRIEPRAKVSAKKFRDSGKQDESRASARSAGNDLRANDDQGCFVPRTA